MYIDWAGFEKFKCRTEFVLLGELAILSFLIHPPYPAPNWTNTRLILINWDLYSACWSCAYWRKSSLDGDAVYKKLQLEFWCISEIWARLLEFYPRREKFCFPMVIIAANTDSNFISKQRVSRVESVLIMKMLIKVWGIAHISTSGIYCGS